MARQIQWTETALNDLHFVWDYIAGDSIHYADSFVKRARDLARSLDLFPFRGRMVPEFHDPTVRELYVKKYRLIYRVTDRSVIILALIHGARDLPTAWEEEQRPSPNE